MQTVLPAPLPNFALNTLVAPEGLVRSYTECKWRRTLWSLPEASCTATLFANRDETLSDGSVVRTRRIGDTKSVNKCNHIEARQSMG